MPSAVEVEPTVDDAADIVVSDNDGKDEKDDDCDNDDVNDDNDDDVNDDDDDVYEDEMPIKRKKSKKRKKKEKVGPMLRNHRKELTPREKCSKMSINLSLGVGFSCIFVTIFVTHC